MNIITSSFTVAELCDQYSRKDIRINRNYQRSDEVWPDAARSFLIETIVLGFPIPKIILSQRTDLKNLKTFKDIVDGQQRTKAITDFFQGDLRLGKNLETEDLCGATIAEIPKEMREQFISYSIGADVLVGASDADVREIFRRMNSYTVPLNPEEQRHALYQGEFKWFIHELTRKCEDAFSELGVFSERDFVRMLDAKLLTELCHALLNGVETTSARKLAALYARYDKEFPNKTLLRRRIRSALDYLAEFEVLKNSKLARSYNFYSLMLATAHAQEAVDTLEDLLGNARLLSKKDVDSNLSKLAEMLEKDRAPREYKAFWDACSEKTNVKAQRETRIEWFYRALTDSVP